MMMISPPPQVQIDSRSPGPARRRACLRLPDHPQPPHKMASPSRSPHPQARSPKRRWYGPRRSHAAHYSLVIFLVPSPTPFNPLLSTFLLISSSLPPSGPHILIPTFVFCTSLRRCHQNTSPPSWPLLLYSRHPTSLSRRNARQ